MDIATARARLENLEAECITKLNSESLGDAARFHLKERRLAARADLDALDERESILKTRADIGEILALLREAVHGDGVAVRTVPPARVGWVSKLLGRF